MFRRQFDPRGSFTPNGAGRLGLDLVNGVLGFFLEVTGRARVAVSVAAATEVRNQGSVFGLLDEVVLTENRNERQLMDGMVARFLSQMLAPSPLYGAGRLPTQANGTVAIGTYLLEETVRVFFAWPHALMPSETGFIERDIRNALQFVARAATNLADGIITPGGATVVIDQVAFDVTQVYGTKSDQVAPYFIPTVRQIALNVNGAINKEPLYLRSTLPVRAAVVTQRVDGYGEVGDIIAQLTLRHDRGSIIGDQPEKWANKVLQQEYEQGGAALSNGVRSNLFLNFQTDGKLSEALNPTAYPNLRFEFWGNKSAKLPANQSMIRVTLLELETVPGVTSIPPFAI